MNKIYSEERLVGDFRVRRGALQEQELECVKRGNFMQSFNGMFMGWASRTDDKNKTLAMKLDLR